MENLLYLGNASYSSWSLRGWLLFEQFGLPVRTVWIDFLSGPIAEQVAALPPARSVPALRLPDGSVVWDSLAIAEELASRYPDAGLWPGDPVARATARSLAAEMHAGFAALRTGCPMNLTVAYRDVPVSDAVASDLRRIERIWDHARGLHGGQGPWLCGAYSVADVFFAPVAARIACYGLAVSAAARDYVDAHLADPAFRRWRALGLARGEHIPWYARDYPQVPWPGPAALSARTADGDTPVNATCPFSGQPVTHLAKIEDVVIGFADPLSRDKVVADAAAWPEITVLLGL